MIDLKLYTQVDPISFPLIALAPCGPHKSTLVNLPLNRKLSKVGDRSLSVELFLYCYIQPSSVGTRRPAVGLLIGGTHCFVMPAQRKFHVEHSEDLDS